MNLQASTLSLAHKASDRMHVCRLCSASLRHTFVDLGMSPPCESFVSREQLDGVEPYYPLHAFVCEECLLVQLGEYISPQAIFEEYAYFSSYSTSWVEHAKNYCQQMAEQLHLDQKSLVVELASNDGYLLQHFIPMNIPALGIEPAANVARVAIEKGVATRIKFFGKTYAGQLATEGLLADLIVGNNVLAQVPDLNDFVAGMVVLLKPEGVITLEFPHLEKLISQGQFDTIYHEHFSYFSLLTIEHLAKKHQLKVIDVEELVTHGGSLRVHLAHVTSARPIQKSVTHIREQEVKAGLEQISTYTAFTHRARKVKRDLLSFLIAAKSAGKTICGYGAPGKGNTLLNYCGIGPDFLDFTVDRNPYKHGRYTPGMHISIEPVEAIDRIKPDYILILPWNLKDEIIKQMHHVREWGAKFIVPIPGVEVIDPRGDEL
ncbi:class I SAM-dependent methyltransferase [Phyllobacterium sp. OV277]|uniref:class I SAM-dependent methyltransferase n=1 Tax=Phyllobacterium sp. OV277 TaxID=1882772 RepID=UPI00088C236D|nr:class I SAM-dependent methyltransferase [Phyllobacterium sp. OV277]SDP38125.1 Methyltransferase domain-containing protein [Phyllobacterium sp. OV277]